MSPSLGAPTLLLVPTALEERRLEDAGGFEPGLALRALCGFGAVAAAARTAQLVAELRPARVVLVGIAGTFDPGRLAVGSACAFDAVVLDGVGVGEGERALGPSRIGFPQWPGGHGTPEHAVLERLELAFPAALGSPREPALLLSTCFASDSPEHAALRLRRFPGALAEDMEGFGAALACSLAGVPLSIVRGASNVVGDRDPSRWRIPLALAAARELAIEVLRA